MLNSVLTHDAAMKYGLELTEIANNTEKQLLQRNRFIQILFFRIPI